VAVTTPSWPRLAARLLRARVSTVQGRWRTREAAGTFAHRAPDEWITLDDDGRPSQRYDVRHTLRPAFERGDYCTAAGPASRVRHDGRPAWQVSLVPPPHKRGLLTLTVDDATGLLVRQEHTTAGLVAELTDLVVDATVEDAVFALQAGRESTHTREVARYDLAHRRPVPTPQWFPWRRGWFDAPELRIVEADVGEGAVGRAPLGQEPPVPDWAAPAHVHRVDHRGWSWSVSSEPPMSPEAARRVVEQVLDLEDR
jgi:hypothetical protein